MKLSKVKIKYSKKSIVYIVMALLILYILFFDSASFYNTYRVKDRMLTLQQDIQKLKIENEQLKLENDKLESDKGILEEKARGLGMQVLIAINRIEIGKGFEAGICIVLLAIIIDRITHALAARKEYTMSS